MKPFISIIVPIYKVEKYLEKCITSLLNQTYTNYEIILVNDGSPDNCGEICDVFKQKSDKISVLHISNSGASVARNKGMEIAKGEFFCFVDSDDWVEENYVGDFAKFASNDTLIVQDAYRDNETVSKKNFFSFKDESFDLKTEFADMILKNKLYLTLGYPWNKLYSRKIIQENGLLFDPEIILGEDEKWNTEYLRFVEKIRFVSRANYHYQFNPNSLSNHEARPFEREMLRFEFRAKHFDYILNNYDQKEENRKILEKEAEEFFRVCIFNRIYNDKLSKEERLTRLKKISQLPKRYLQLLNSELPLRNVDYGLLKSGKINLMDRFKTLRLKINK